MRRMGALILVLALAGNAWGASAQSIISRMKAAMAGIKDYSVSAVMSVESPTVHVRESRFRIYYRKPDRLHIEPEGGFALVPRGTFLGDPFERIVENNNLRVIGDGKMEGRACWLVRLTPKEKAPDALEFTLWIEKQRGLLIASRSEPAPGARIQARWKYARIDGRYWMPSRIDVEIQGLPAQLTREHGPFIQTSGKASGRVQIRFKEYRINQGIPDSVFRRNQKR